MPNAVVILGAGASASFGVPTLRTIFKDRFARKYLSQNQWLYEHLNNFFWEPRGFSLEDSEESLTIEEMLTILRDIDYSRQQAPSPETQYFQKSLYILIQHALFVGKSTQGRHLNSLIYELRRRFDHITWSSFNWDCIFESSFWYSSGNVNMSRINPNLAIQLNNWRGHSVKDLFLKLHGGINWWMINGALTYINFSHDLPRMWEQYSLDTTGTIYPVILEPSYYKYTDQLYNLLSPQWGVFIQKLAEADFVLIIGYSLPDADFNARSALTRTFQENSNARWAAVDPSPSICAKFRRLFGRNRLRIFESDLVSFNNGIEANLDLAINF
jgi:hypothetical protein